MEMCLTISLTYQLEPYFHTASGVGAIITDNTGRSRMHDQQPASTVRSSYWHS
jgi:hypothetical protein